jgi:hypothetical protein
MNTVAEAKRIIESGVQVEVFVKISDDHEILVKVTKRSLLDRLAEMDDDIETNVELLESGIVIAG